MAKRPSQNRGLYIPEWPKLEIIADSESERTGEEIRPATMMRKFLQKGISAWSKKNPSIPLDI